MPSRINIGPENGPYVAINEENGNLQLEDNSGNVVAEWDETNAQWDFVENDISGVGGFDSESVNTEQASNNIAKPQATHIGFQEDGETKIRRENGEVIHSEPFAGDTFEAFLDGRSDPFHLALSEGTYEVEIEQIEIRNSAQILSGAGMGVTTIKLEDNTDDPSESEIGIVDVRGEDGDPIQMSHVFDLTIDGNSENQNLFPDYLIENLEFEYAEDCYAVRVESVDANDDSFDLDECRNCVIEGSISRNPERDAFHNSGGADFNRFSNCVSYEAGLVAFTQQNGGTDNQYINVQAFDSEERDFDITDSGGAGGAIVVGAKSDGNAPEPNVFTGTDYAQVNVRVINNSWIDDYEEYQGDRTQVDSDDMQTIFDVSDPVDVRSGSVNGPSVGGLRYTFEDGSVWEYGSSATGDAATGRDDNGDLTTTEVVEPLSDVVKLEFISAQDGEYGWRVFVS